MASSSARAGGFGVCHTSEGGSKSGVLWVAGPRGRSNRFRSAVRVLPSHYFLSSRFRSLLNREAALRSPKSQKGRHRCGSMRLGRDSIIAKFGRMRQHPGMRPWYRRVRFWSQLPITTSETTAYGESVLVLCSVIRGSVVPHSECACACKAGSESAKRP